MQQQTSSPLMQGVGLGLAGLNAIGSGGLSAIPGLLTAGGSMLSGNGAMTPFWGGKYFG
jgi:hypothetical protein